MQSSIHSQDEVTGNRWRADWRYNERTRTVSVADAGRGTGLDSHAVAQNVWLHEVVTRLEQQTQTLAAQMGQKSTNSSLPPSADPALTPLPPPAGSPSASGAPIISRYCYLRNRSTAPSTTSPRLSALPDAFDPRPRPPRHPAGAPSGYRGTASAGTGHRPLPLSAAASLLIGRVTPQPPAGRARQHLRHPVAPNCDPVLQSSYRLSRREVADGCAALLGAPLAVRSVAGICRGAKEALAETMVTVVQTLVQADSTHAWTELKFGRWVAISVVHWETASFYYSRLVSTSQLAKILNSVPLLFRYLPGEASAILVRRRPSDSLPIATKQSLWHYRATLIWTDSRRCLRMRG
jgi:hypothetical protein